MKNKLIKIGSIIAVVIVLVTMTVIPTFAATADSQSSSDTMTLKAGTYRFNDVVVLSQELNNFSQDINFTLETDFEGYTALATCTHMGFYGTGFVGDGGGREWYKMSVNILSLEPDLLASQGVTYPQYMPIYTYYVDDNQGVWSPNPTSCTIPIDQEVSDIFGTWFIANTNYNEVNASNVPISVGQTRYWNETLNSLNYTFYATDEFSYTSDGVTYTGMTIGKSSPTDFSSSYAVKYGSTLVYGLSQSSGWVDQRDRYFTLNSLPDNEDVIAFILANSTVVDSSQGDAYDKGYSDGYHQGVIDGKEIGFDEGYEKGLKDGEKIGYDKGLLDGEDIGFNKGFNAAASENFGENLLGATLNVPIDALNQFALFEVGGVPITLGGIVGAIVALLLFLLFLKMFNGG